MSDSSNSDIAVFPLGEQQEFLESVLAVLGVHTAARVCSRSDRTVRDWHREKVRMPAVCVLTLAESAGIRTPLFSTQNRYAHTSLAGKKGAASLLRKYGGVPVNREHRKESWEKWWSEIGKHKRQIILAPREISIPRKSSSLAELIGIIMGDGGLSTYQLTISLNRDTDRLFASFVIARLRELFSVRPQVSNPKDSNVLRITVSRKALVDHLHTLGLPVGHKIRHQLDIPDWIKRNQVYARACVRGLVDTDGCVVIHRYHSKNRFYSYKKLTFTSASRRLLESVALVLETNSMHPRIAGKSVWLDSAADLSRYFKVIGSSNPKHLKRYASKDRMAIHTGGVA